MSSDTDLDIMNLIKELGEDSAAFYLRSDDESGFYYYSGSIQDMGDALMALMGQDKTIEAMVIHAVKEYME